ncbi:Sensor histidine kinase TmoS [compost metagenome]
MNNKPKALKYYGLLQKVTGTKPSRWSELVSSNIEIANLELKESNHKQAWAYIDKADKQSKLDNSELLTSSVNNAYGDYYKQLGNYTEAVKYYKIAEHGASIYNKEQYADLLKALTGVLIKSGNIVAAQAYFDKYALVSDSLSQSKISLNLAEMEARFQNDFKQKKITELNRENETRKLELKQEAITRWLLIGGAFLLLVALALIYLNFRNKQKANLLLDKKNQELDFLNEQLTKANQAKAKLFGIISHDLRSPVSQLFTFLKLQQENAGFMPEEEKTRHQQRLIQSSAHLLETMEDLLLWSKSQMENFELDSDEINIRQLFKETNSVMQGQAEVKGLAFQIGEVSPEHIKTDHNLLVIVLRNLLQNAINHAFINGVIYLNAGVNDQQQPFLSILNQGEVIPRDKIDELLNNTHVKSKSSGYGLLIVKELLLKINAVLKITSNKEGTMMQVIFLYQL